MQYHKRSRNYAAAENTRVNNREIKMVPKGNQGKGDESLETNSKELARPLICPFFETIVWRANNALQKKLENKNTTIEIDLYGHSSHIDKYATQ